MVKVELLPVSTIGVPPVSKAAALFCTSMATVAAPAVISTLFTLVKSIALSVVKLAAIFKSPPTSVVVKVPRSWTPARVTEPAVLSVNVPVVVSAPKVTSSPALAFIIKLSAAPVIVWFKLILPAASSPSIVMLAPKVISPLVTLTASAVIFPLSVMAAAPVLVVVKVKVSKRVFAPTVERVIA